MQNSSPQYQLFAEARALADEDFAWHFELKSPDRSLHLDVTDQEPDAPWERLELLAVVRGLEALDQPSRVMLLTPSRYVTHGLRYGLTEWRESGWMWESFGQMTPIKHEDLWRRVDHTLQFHRVQCRICRVDAAHATLPEPEFARQREIPVVRKTPRPRETQRIVLVKRERVNVGPSRHAWPSLRQRLAGALVGLGQAIAPQVASA